MKKTVVSALPSWVQRAALGTLLGAAGLSLASTLLPAKSTKPSTAAAAPVAVKLGQVSFPNSGPASVQETFHRGLAALHSFWYEEAIELFQETTKIDPDFALGYWGEALSYNHSLWQRQDLEYARQTLAKIKDTSKLTPRERAYIDAARQLYGEGDKLSRDIAYSKALEKIYHDYPDDLEAAAFYALSILGTVRPADLRTQGFARQLKAGAIATEVYRKSPEHPGAAHYIIHAFDDPEHAILALHAARRYAQIAPAAFHAQHMPSHIFVQLGFWDESARSNETSWRVSDEWVQRKNYSLKLRDYHSYHWLVYTYLQQGRQKDATRLVEYIRETVRQNGLSSVNFFDQIASIYVVETQNWERAAELLAPPPGSPTADASRAASTPTEFCSPGGPGGSTLTRDSQRNRSDLPEIILAFAQATRSSPDAVRLLEKLRAAPSEPGDAANDAYRQITRDIQLRQVEALLYSGQGRTEEALAVLATAAKLEAETTKPSGPPRLIKPSHELYGELFLRAGRAQEAVEQFAIALNRQPGRALSLLGLARAKDRVGDRAGATVAYQTLLQNWQQADRDRPELAEARNYVAAAGSLAQRE